MRLSSEWEPGSSFQKKKNILLFEKSDKSDLELFRSLLGNEFDVFSANATSDNLPVGLQLARHLRPDLVIADLSFCLNQRQFPDQLRECTRSNTLPILITASDFSELSPADLQWLFAKVDDFLLRPYCTRELPLRIESIFWKMSLKSLENRTHLMHGNLIMDIARMQVQVGTKQVELSVLEFKLLRFFLENPEKVLSRERILKGVWTNANVSLRTIDAHMASLRKKLAGFDHQFATIYGGGYALRPKAQQGTESEMPVLLAARVR